MSKMHFPQVSPEIAGIFVVAAIAVGAVAFIKEQNFLAQDTSADRTAITWHSQSGSSSLLSHDRK